MWKSTCAPDHEAGEFGFCHPCGGNGGHISAVAQNGDAIGNRDHFIQLVADEDDGFALIRHLLEGLEKAFGLLRREHGSRLVQNENLRTAVEHLDDFDSLLLAHRELPNLGLGINGQAILVADARHLGIDLVVLSTKLTSMEAQDNILGHGLHGHQHEVLMDHAHPGGNGVARRIEAHALTVDEDFALIRVIETGEDIHQRRLAGAIFAQQRVDFALFGRKAHVCRWPARLESAW